ncbi:site-specific DNA-methyltransferase (plasmid) [Virgibacillus necropolis]|uniref:site-specific DNA-methyltransferase n=1 Tax=Virgibacillus necropolis TaxID=163877 RepID=UPI00384BBE52
MSMNQSKLKRDDLIEKINKIKLFFEENSNDRNAKQLSSYISEMEKEVYGKKYGLVFEEHKESTESILAKNTPILTEEKDLFIDNDGEMNFLIEGDNLAALKLLKKTHLGKIDLIYIDPPYNTRNQGFIYDDKKVDKLDTFKHSKWISFMSKRLKLAKDLLSDTGVIFVSIDDNEQANLNLLMNEVFGENNFIAQIIWERAYAPVNLKKHFSESHDYVLCYAAKSVDLTKSNGLPRTDKQNNDYKNIDNDPRGPWKAGNPSVGPAVEKNIYEVTLPSGRKVLPPKGRSWLYDEEKLKKLIKDNRIFFGKDGDSVWSPKMFLSEVKDGLTPMTIWKYGEVDHSQTASKNLKEIFEGNSVFTYPKPVKLIKRILELYSKPDSIILDFFAGSGTTGQAVLELNNEDGGNRKFILSTNNENNICKDVTYERIKRIINGYPYVGKKTEKLFEKKINMTVLKKAEKLLNDVQEIKDKEKDNFDEIKSTVKDGNLLVNGIKQYNGYTETKNGSLKYFKIDFVPISEKLYYEYADQLLIHVRELVELENAINFTDNDEVNIILTDEELGEFIQNGDKTDICKTIYLGHEVLTSAEQEGLFKKNDITVNVIPDYYYKELRG